MTFNEFLASPEGRLKVNNTQADLLLGNFARYDVTIRRGSELWDFEDAHPELFRIMTEEDKRNGLQTLDTMWGEYLKPKLDYIPLRKLDRRFFR
jgi:hypothetical protein